MTGTSSHSGTGAGGAIRKGVGMVHGTGEAIRGNLNAAVDSATGDHEAAARNQNIAARGVDEFENGHYHGTGAGVTPHDTQRERVNRVAQGESAPIASSNHGPHTTNVGNKVDPRVDSDVDHRGPVADDCLRTWSGRTKDCVDPVNCCTTTPFGRTTPMDYYPTNELDESKFYYDEPTEKKISEPVSQAKRQNSHARGTSHDEPSRSSTLERPKRCDTMPHLHHHCPADGNEQIGDDYYTNTPSKTPHDPHSSHIANIFDPRVEDDAPLAEPHSTQKPHQSGFLNLLDPRVDRKAVKKLREGESGLMMK